MLCKNCNNKISDSANFCEHCGTKVVREIRCGDCNTKLNEFSNFCSKCGTKVEQANNKNISDTNFDFGDFEDDIDFDYDFDDDIDFEDDFDDEDSNDFAEQSEQNPKVFSFEDKNYEKLSDAQINKHNKLMREVDCEAFQLKSIKDGFNKLGGVYDGNKWGFRDAKNNLIIPFIYDQVDETSFYYEVNGKYLAIVEKDGYWGIIDMENNIVFPFAIYNVVDEIGALAEDYPAFKIHPTENCMGWGSIFLNKDFDVRFDQMGEERYYESYPEGREWLRKYKSYLGKYRRSAIPTDFTELNL